jgi:hypothetical protein
VPANTASIGYRGGINWAWMYFKDEGDAGAFAATLKDQGYDGRHDIEQLAEPVSTHGGQVPAGSWVVHYHTV